MDNIKQVIIWGHKLHSHKHSYIHNAFYNAFQHLRYKTLWLNSSDNISRINFSNSLFITEGSVEANMPILQDCYYILHNSSNLDYYSTKLPKSHFIQLQVYTHDVVNTHEATLIDKTTLSYYKDNCLFLPWATDLLPNEINENIEKVKMQHFNTQNNIAYVGTINSVCISVHQYCHIHNIPFPNDTSFFQNNIEVNDSITLIQNSLMAPAFQDEWQCRNGYIPCRIFKNISYGKMGITNNVTVHELYNNTLIYDNDINIALTRGLDFEKMPSEYKIQTLIPLMELTRDKHTYLNRINTIFNFFNDWYTKNTVVLIPDPEPIAEEEPVTDPESVVSDPA
jgi:hypothetical protein